jgi:hypothetical protein
VEQFKGIGLQPKGVDNGWLQPFGFMNLLKPKARLCIFSLDGKFTQNQ